MRIPHPHRRITTLFAATLVAFGVCTLTGPPASAHSVGYVRLAHLSPDTPPIDIYLISMSGATRQRCVEGAGYGVVSDYMGVPPGAYSVAVRPGGASQTQPPILANQLSVEAGKAYTVAAVGLRSTLALRSVSDELSMPVNGRARVRILQASIQAPILTVSSTADGLGSNETTYANTTAYKEVNSGPAAVQLRPISGGQPTTVDISLASGNVYTLIVLDRAQGVTAQLQRDALAQTRPPTGGIETGAGGTRAGDPVPGPLNSPPLAAALLAAALLALTLLVWSIPAGARRLAGGRCP